MAFYDLTSEERATLVQNIKVDLLRGLKNEKDDQHILYFQDEDTYVRKAAYQQLGKIYFENADLQHILIRTLDHLFETEDEKVRQTVINAAGEIGKKEFNPVMHFFRLGLFDDHHKVRNAVIGSMKKMGQKNPLPILSFASEYILHPDAEIRREICHGLELRGRTHPEEILPLLQKLEDDQKPRVRKTLVHVLGQIAYKKGCLEKVLDHLKTWSNKTLIRDALEEIVDVHARYQNFSYYSQKQALQIIESNEID